MKKYKRIGKKTKYHYRLNILLTTDMINQIKEKYPEMTIASIARTALTEFLSK